MNEILIFLDKFSFDVALQLILWDRKEPQNNSTFQSSITKTYYTEAV